MGRTDYLYSGFVTNLKFDPTPSQDSFFRTAADFLCGDDDDILVVNGYAGTGKTSAVASIIRTLSGLKIKTVLLAPTGRAAKVLSGYAGRSASTVHKHIYHQKAVSGDGFGEFSLNQNKDRDTLFVVDEVSLIGIDSSANNATAAFGTGNLLE
ncbi:MAG: AAA family ATPase, partial [Candidatus Cryptobacteroides sp.]